jgi:hypothetical protein
MNGVKYISHVWLVCEVDVLIKNVGWISAAYPPTAVLIHGGCATLIHPTYLFKVHSGDAGWFAVAPIRFIPTAGHGAMK